MSDYPNNEWLTLERPGEYDRLVRLARRRLIGHEHHAEDVVSRAILKWSRMPPAQRRAGHIEQVIKTEAYSVLRSEDRLRHRQTRSVTDPGFRELGARQQEAEQELWALRLAVAQTCKRLGFTPGAQDMEVFELILTGMNLAEIERSLGISRHRVRSIRRTWKRILRHTLQS